MKKYGRVRFEGGGVEGETRRPIRSYERDTVQRFRARPRLALSIEWRCCLQHRRIVENCLSDSSRAIVSKIVEKRI